MTRQELLAKLVKESGNDTEALVVFQDMDTGTVFTLKDVAYESDPDSTGATLFIRGDAS